MRLQGKPTRRREYIITTAGLTLEIAFNVRWENYKTVTCLMHLMKGIKYALTDIFIAMFLDAKKATNTVLLFCYVILIFIFCMSSLYSYFVICILPISKYG